MAVTHKKKPVQKARKEPLCLQLPDFTDHNAVSQFQELLKHSGHRYGVARLKQYTDKVLRYQRYLEEYQRKLHSTLAVVNGERTVHQKDRDTKNPHKRLARKFFAHLSTEQLIQQCTLFNVDYSENTERSQILDALVTAYTTAQISYTLPEKVCTDSEN
jgi:hypothetical protein